MLSIYLSIYCFVRLLFNWLCWRRCKYLIIIIFSSEIAANFCENQT